MGALAVFLARHRHLLGVTGDHYLAGIWQTLLINGVVRGVGFRIFGCSIALAGYFVCSPSFMWVPRISFFVACQFTRVTRSQLGRLMGGIDNWGHVGGLVGGAAAGWLLGPNLMLVDLPPLGDGSTKGPGSTSRKARGSGSGQAVIDYPPLAALLGSDPSDWDKKLSWRTRNATGAASGGNALLKRAARSASAAAAASTGPLD